MPVFAIFLSFFVTLLILSCGAGCWFPFGNSHFPGVFYNIFSSESYFHQFRVFLHSFFEIFRITATFIMKFELLYENFIRSCDVTFKMAVNRELLIILSVSTAFLHLLCMLFYVILFVLSFQSNCVYFIFTKCDYHCFSKYLPHSVPYGSSFQYR